jgi:hypothetical protein
LQVAVRRWGSKPGQCVEAALREEVVEVSRTLLHWIRSLQKERQQQDTQQQGQQQQVEEEETSAEGAGGGGGGKGGGGGGGGGRVVSLLRELEEVGHELESW